MLLTSVLLDENLEGLGVIAPPSQTNCPCADICHSEVRDLIGGSVHLEEAWCALRLTQERMNCDVVQGAGAESEDDGLSLIDSLVDGVGPPSHVYFVDN